MNREQIDLKAGREIMGEVIVLSEGLEREGVAIDYARDDKLATGKVQIGNEMLQVQYSSFTDRYFLRTKIGTHPTQGISRGPSAEKRARAILGVAEQRPEIKESNRR